MKKFLSFPKIGQFRQAIRHIVDKTRYVGKDDNGKAIYDPSKVPPTLTFEGTVKLHGTNSGVSINRDGEIWAQSRERNISIDSDNYGFAFFVEKNKDIFRKLFDQIDWKDADFKTIFGEWCGQGIQSGVAISTLPKMFVIFAVKLSYEDNTINKNYYLKSEDFKHLKSPEHQIYNIQDYQTFHIDIDFDNPATSQNKLIEITKEVEKECPVGKAFGVSGIGEGVVWKYWEEDGSVVQFKVKGDKHAGKKNKVKKMAEIDPIKLKNIQDFVEYATPEWRLQQMYEKVLGSVDAFPDRKKLGEFIKAVMRDIIDEETDVMVKNNLEPKDIGKNISSAVKKWFFAKEEI